MNNIKIKLSCEALKKHYVMMIESRNYIKNISKNCL